MTFWDPLSRTHGWSYLRYDYQTDRSFVYVNIPKNASCWLKENFGGYEYNFVTNSWIGDVNSAVTKKYALQAPKTYVVALRDPVQRWQSGFAQCWYGSDPAHPGFYRNQGWDSIFSQVVFDEHTAPQHVFLEGIDFANTVWFGCDQWLTVNFGQWLKTYFHSTVRGLDQDPCNVYNVSARGPVHHTTGLSQQEIITEVAAVLDMHPEYVERLREFYQQDYALISNYVRQGL